MLSVIKQATDTIFFLSETQRISAQRMVRATQLAVAMQYFISSTAMAPIAHRWTQMITVQDLWSHTASSICAASQQYWRNQAASGSTPTNHYHNIRKARFLRFCVSPGRAETLVKWGGKTNHHSTAFSLSNVIAKDYRNRSMCVEVIVCNISVVFFETRCSLP